MAYSAGKREVIVDIFVEFSESLERYVSSRLSVNRILCGFRSGLDREFDFIKKSSDFDSCAQSFDVIFSIQRALSTAKYKYNFELSDFFDEFVYKFDRDDLPSRGYIYGVIKDSAGIEDAVSKVMV